MRVMAVQSVKVVTATCLLGVFFLSGALAVCKSFVFVTAPKQMEALSGSCLQIPCNFGFISEEIFKSATAISGAWLTRNSTSPNGVIFDSSRMNNIYPMSLTGDLRQGNCTTLFSSLITNYTDTYYFRIESVLVTQTACDPLQITVNDSPWRPSIEISGDLTEKQSVTITCSAFTPCPHSPPQLTWNLQQNPQNTREENTDGTFTTKIQKIITLSEEHDGFNITCSARYPVDEGKDVKTAEERTTLSVSYPPRDTSVVINPTDPVSVGSVVNLTCSCRGNPPAIHFVWFLISDGRLELIKVDTQVYSFRVASRDRGRLYYCGCRNDLDIQLSIGRQLIFEGDQQSGPIGVHVIVKILGIIILISTLVIFECWFRSRCSTKPMKDAAEADYVNSVVERRSA